jgi:hypothetical protein
MPKPPLPPEKYKGKKAEILMTESEYKALTNLAKSQNMTLSKFVREVLREWAKNKQNNLHPDLF